MDRRTGGYNTSGIIFVTATLLCWSSVLLFLRHLHTEIDAWTANGWRYGMCAAVLCPLALIRQAQGRFRSDIWRRAIVPSIFNCIGQVCFGFSIYYIEAGLSGFLLRFAVISSTFGAMVLFADERLLLRSSRFWGGMLLVIGGAVGTIFLGIYDIAGGIAIGIVLAALAGTFFGLYGVAVRYYMRGIASAYSFSAISTYTAAVMLCLMFARSESRGAVVFDLSLFSFMCLVLSAVLGIGLGHILYYAAIARLGVAISGAIIQLAPFIGGAASVVIFGEILTPGQWVSGVVMIVGGVLLLQAERERARPAAAQPASFPLEIEDAGDPTAIGEASVLSASDEPFEEASP